jgi:hypothetical protein
MRFLNVMIPGAYAEAGALPDPEAFAAMGRYNDELAKAGVLLAVDGLLPSAKGARVSFATGKPVVNDGPFAEAKEVIGGYWILQVKSKEEAVAWATRCPALKGDTIEVRQVAELTDLRGAEGRGPPGRRARGDREVVTPRSASR